MTTDSFNLNDVLGKYVKKPSELARPELALIYGSSGSGKSWLAASTSQIPGINKVLILDVEGSCSGVLAGFDDDKIDIVDCRRETPAESFQFLNTILERLFDAKTEHSYDVVVIDTFDVAQSDAAD